MAESEKNIKSLFIFLSLLSLFFLILNPQNFINKVKSFVSYILSPRFSVKIVNKINDINYNLSLFFDTEIRCKILEKENMELKAKVVELERYKKEYEKFSYYFNALDKTNYSLKPSDIISIDPLNPYLFIFIDKGIEDGVLQHNPVLIYRNGEWFLIGKVIESYSRYSKVILVTNPDLCFISDTSKSRGLICGNNSPNLEYKYIDGKITYDEWVFTSKVSLIFPPYIKIGKISEIKDNIDETSIKAEVSIFSLRDIDMVWVMNYIPSKFAGSL